MLFTLTKTALPNGNWKLVCELADVRLGGKGNLKFKKKRGVSLDKREKKIKCEY